MNVVNKVMFTQEEVRKGMHHELIDHLLEYNRKSTTFCNDIHIVDSYSDGTLEVEWAQVWREDGGVEGFKFIDYDHYVTVKVEFPDGHYDYYENDEIAEEAQDTWLKAHPEYQVNSITGHYYNVDEERRMREEILNTAATVTGAGDTDGDNDCSTWGTKEFTPAAEDPEGDLK